MYSNYPGCVDRICVSGFVKPLIVSTQARFVRPGAKFVVEKS